MADTFTLGRQREGVSLHGHSLSLDLDTRRLRYEVQSIYARVAGDPSGDFHFHRGPDYAADLIQYDREALAALPHQSTASFAGVANPHRLGPIGEALVVADIGCGAGMDLLLAAEAVRRRGRAIGAAVDRGRTPLWASERGPSVMLSLMAVLGLYGNSTLEAIYPVPLSGAARFYLAALRPGLVH